MKRMLEVTPEHIHDRSGIFMGSYDEVQQVIEIHKKYGDNAKRTAGTALREAVGMIDI
jgi:hypothetical protein